MLLAALTAALTLAAAPVSIPLPADGVDSIAYSQGHLLWATDDGGPIAIHTPQGILATLPRKETDTVALAQLAANANGYIASVEEEHHDLVVRGGYDGSVQTLLDCVPSGPNDQLGVTAGTSGYAFFAPACGHQLDTVTAAGAITPIPGITLNGFASIAYNEPYLAAELSSPKGTVRILNLADGTQRDFPRAFNDDSSRFSLRPDGGLAIGPGVDIGRSETEPPGAYAWPPNAAKPTFLSSNVLSLGDVFTSQDRVLLSTNLPVGGQAALGIVPFAGGDVTPVGAPGAGFPRIPVALEGDTAVFRSFGCDGRDQVTLVDVTARRDADTQYGCPVSLDNRDIGRRTIGVRCPNGCHADLRLADLTHDRPVCLKHPDIVYVKPPLCPVVARVKLRLPPSPNVQHARIELTGSGLKARRHHRSIPVYARLTTGHNGPQLIALQVRTLQLRRR